MFTCDNLFSFFGDSVVLSLCAAKRIQFQRKNKYCKLRVFSRFISPLALDKPVILHFLCGFRS